MADALCRPVVTLWPIGNAAFASALGTTLVYATTAVQVRKVRAVEALACMGLLSACSASVILGTAPFPAMYRVPKMPQEQSAVVTVNAIRDATRMERAPAWRIITEKRALPTAQ